MDTIRDRCGRRIHPGDLLISPSGMLRCQPCEYSDGTIDITNSEGLYAFCTHGPGWTLTSDVNVVPEEDGAECTRFHILNATIVPPSIAGKAGYTGRS